MRWEPPRKGKLRRAVLSTAGTQDGSALTAVLSALGFALCGFGEHITGRTFARLAAIAALACFATGCADFLSYSDTISAVPRPFLTPPPTSLITPSVSTMPNSAVAATAPPGFISFCVRFADQCQALQNTPATITMTDSNWRTLKQVNSAVNSSIWAEYDQDHYGRAEYWTIPTDGYGDCEDYALVKRRDLIAEGFPVSALRLAIVIAPREARHAVLTVVTDKGDYVLDNLSDNVVAWNTTGYTWIERQDAKRPMVWVSLQFPERMIAANASVLVGRTLPSSSTK